jgi:hypothetical protein
MTASPAGRKSLKRRMTMDEAKKIIFTKANAGCYGDSARGTYIGRDVAIPIAKAYGFDPYPTPCDCDYCGVNHNSPNYDIFRCEYYHEIWDEAETFLNNRTEDGWWWGSTENGDWGLWIADEEEPK